MKKATPASALRVLVVDDCKDAADSLGALVTFWGHDARVAYDGPTALQLAEVFEPQLVLLDIGLPGVNGWEVAARLRQLPCAKNAMLLAVTALGQDEDIERSLATGIHGHLVKPINPKSLEEVLSRLTLSISGRGEQHPAVSYTA